MQTGPLLLNLPSLSCSAAVFLTMVHSRTGYFPPVLRLAPETGNMVIHFKVVEILKSPGHPGAGTGEKVDMAKSQDLFNLSLIQSAD